MIIGERIKQARLKKGYTQEQLGNIIGVSKVSVCCYENGSRTPTMAIFLKLSEALDITVDFMLGNDVTALNESLEPYSVILSKEDIEILKELKNNPELYNKLCTDPKRIIQLIVRKLK